MEGIHIFIQDILTKNMKVYEYLNNCHLEIPEIINLYPM